MNKTKYQPGDKVRVKSDLVKYNKKYYMENNDISRVFVESMSYLKGKIVTISKITSSGVYGIEEDGYSWTDEMFEDIISEYVECVKTKESYFIKGIIYKVINATNLASAEVISNIKTGSYDPGNILYVTLKDSNGKQCYKNSTREAYEAQQKPKTPKFEVGKWYKNLGTDGNYIGKFEKLEETRWYCSDHIYKGVHRNYGGNLTYVFKNAVECTVEEIQQYLPDGHPDKKFQFVVGEYYSQDFGDKLPRIFIYKNDTMQSYYINPNVSVLFRNNFDSTCLKNAVKATPEEKQWLNACIKANKFITKEEAEAFAKTLKPVITVESEMKRLGLAIGDVIKVTTEAVEDGWCQVREEDNYEKLDNVRGRIYPITGAFIALNSKLYLSITSNLMCGVLATEVTKVPDKFLLGSYDVKVTSNGVKIGCTTLPVDDVIGVLDDFMKISRKFGTESSDYIMINGVKVTYEIANNLLEFIGDN